MSGISSNLFPFKGSLTHVNRKKSRGLRCGEYGGCSICDSSFVQDNARSHTAEIVKQFLAEMVVVQIELPPYLPDLLIVPRKYRHVYKWPTLFIFISFAYV